MIAHIHGRENRQLEEATPQRIYPCQQLGIGAHQQGESLPVAELIIAPFLEPLENRVETQFRMALELAENSDVAGVPDLFT